MSSGPSVPVTSSTHRRHRGVAKSLVRLIPCGLLSFSALACSDRPAATPPPSSVSSLSTSSSPQRVAPLASSPPGSTAIDEEHLAIELPGRWEQQRAEDGAYDLRLGKEQIMISTHPFIEGLDGAASADRLSEAQRKALVERFHCAETGEVRRVTTPHARIVRSAIVCQNPAMVITFGAANGPSDRVISYEHLWYDATALSSEIARADTANLETLRFKPASGHCPETSLAAAMQNDGACFEAAVLGDAVAADCGRTLESRHFVRDETAAKAIGERTGKVLACYRSPAK